MGDLPVSELAKLITNTMPDGDPESCTGPDAEAVAAYIHDAFYSPIAQARLRPVRVELSHLTSRQYRESLLDLAQSFTWKGKHDDRRGVTAEYFRGQWADKKKRVSDRIEPAIEFKLIQSGLFEHDYLFPKDKSKDDAPIEKARQQSVCMQWHGGIFAPETGLYEFVVNTNAGFKLWVNGEAPLIDASVASGQTKGGRERIRLLGGRVYSLRLEVTRVFEDDVSVSLAWRTPSGIEAPIPTRVLRPDWYPSLLVVDTPLPADDQSTGFARASSVSAGWDEATTHAALEAADKLIASLPDLLKLPELPAEARPKAQAFCSDFALRAFRRPMSEEERARYVDQFFSGEVNWPEATKRSLVATLKSPRFLYPEVGAAGAEPDWRAASRLALALWDSVPDESLRLLAQKGELNRRDQVEEQARWMARDPRAVAKLHDFFRHWLRVESGELIRRDPEAFPGFDSHVAADLRISLELLLEEAAASEVFDFRQFFLSDEVYVNRRLAGFLWIQPPPEGEAFEKRPYQRDRRTGVVTHPYVVANHAYFRESSPIHRGVFLARHVLGRSLNPPPVAVAPLAPDLHPGLTTRDRVALQTSPNACQYCHVLINDLGFSLEQFDAVGRFRQEELGKPIDPTGGYVTTDGQRADFENARQLAEFLAGCRDVHRAFAVQLFEHVANQPVMAYGERTPDRLVERFEQSGYNVRDLLVEIAVIVTMAAPEQITGPE
jgi:hypothetical protein